MNIDSSLLDRRCISNKQKELLKNIRIMNLKNRGLKRFPIQFQGWDIFSSKHKVKLKTSEVKCQKLEI